MNFGPQRPLPPVEHKLVFGHLKHWHVLRDGTLKHHDKVLELQSSKQLVNYALLFNVFELPRAKIARRVPRAEPRVLHRPKNAGF
jgi:hypothetical protein